MGILLTSTPKQLRERFYKLETYDNLAYLLEIPTQQLIYYAIRFPIKNQYYTFTIRKKSGGDRTISVPVTPLKIIQSKLNQVFTSIYEPRHSTHGFIVGKSIVSNAEAHLQKKSVLNIDLKDFFPSINFGRVRGLLMYRPYNLPDNIATSIARICCFNNELPQGAPTSPILSNMICERMDRHLQALANRHKCIYTRYADDITFSTWRKNFPNGIIQIGSESSERLFNIGPEIRQIIEDNGFRVNPEKVYIRSSKERQEVTGITVNERLNVKRTLIRQVRAMFHAWEKYGLENAQATFESKYAVKHRNPHKPTPLMFLHTLRGKIEYIGMVRGKNDPIYLKFLNHYRKLLNPAADDVIVTRKTGKVFISYARAQAEFARGLVSSLSERGIGTWIDIDDISGGANWGNAIQDGLKICDAMILILTPDSMKSSNVQDEWQYYRDTNKPIIPILYKHTDRHFQINRLQYVDFISNNYERALGLLLRELSKCGIE
jgi:RNA-directed DNA polymerase